MAHHVPLVEGGQVGLGGGGSGGAHGPGETAVVPALGRAGLRPLVVGTALLSGIAAVARGAGGNAAPAVSPVQEVPAGALQVLRRNLLQEAGGPVGAGAAKEHTLARTGEVQLLLCPGHGHVAQPPLLLHLVRLSDGPDAGENALLGSHHKDHRELQALGRVHGHHHHAVLVRVVAV